MYYKKINIIVERITTVKKLENIINKLKELNNVKTCQNILNEIKISD